jgi:hypothetical protein
MCLKREFVYASIQAQIDALYSISGDASYIWMCE